MFTRPSHFFLPGARLMQSTFSHPVSLQRILILSFHLFLGTVFNEPAV